MSIRAAAVVAASLALGCATTQQTKMSAQEKESACTFLGPSVCAELSSTPPPGRFSSAAVSSSGEPVAELRYVDTEAPWTQYHKVLLSPITFWGGDDTSLSPSDQQKLAEYFYQVVEKQLATRFELVQEPGPGTLTIQCALIDAQTATPILRTISMVIPQARALATLKYVATGTYAFVGGATAEVKILDSLSHRVLAAGVDRRMGGGALTTAAQWQLGDAENAMNAWATQLTDRLGAWTSGT
ncbi:MAG TPA: DUF3313 domain-containing protein [Myxococcota bacterium]|jgi:hypothetical protein|nr:DUF3313 domain-containing protein [Myxococcota bacterium]